MYTPWQMKRLALLALSVLPVLLAAQITAAQQPNRMWYQYSSEEGGFAFTAPAGVKVNEELIPGSADQMRGVKASVDLGTYGQYSGVASFWPVSLANREDTDKEFSSRFKSIYAASCADARFERTSVEGLPAYLFRGSKCGNLQTARHLGLWVFAGNRLFTFDLYPVAQKTEDTERILSSFKIASPRFMSPGEWTTFEHPFGGFSVSFMGFPLHQAIAARPGATIYSLENYAYFAGALPAIPGTRDEVLDAVEKLVQTTAHGTVTAKYDLTSAGLPARKLRISYQTPGGQMVKFVFALVAKEKEYLLTVSCKEQTPIPQSDVDHFFDSFREIKPQH